jgi:hypothetical protein
MFESQVFNLPSENYASYGMQTVPEVEPKETSESKCFGFDSVSGAISGILGAPSNLLDLATSLLIDTFTDTTKDTRSNTTSDAYVDDSDAYPDDSHSDNDAYVDDSDACPDDTSNVKTTKYSRGIPKISAQNSTCSGSECSAVLLHSVRKIKSDYYYFYNSVSKQWKAHPNESGKVLCGECFKGVANKNRKVKRSENKEETLKRSKVNG